MKQLFLAVMLLSGMLAGCTNSNKQSTNNDMDEKLELTQEWDKVFPLSEKVYHKKVIPWDTLTEFFAKNLK